MVPNVRRRFHGTFCSKQCDFYLGVRKGQASTKVVSSYLLNLRIKCCCFCCWHGNRNYALGVCRCCYFCLLQGSMCLRPDCGLCSITMNGFKIEDNVGNSPARRCRPQWLRYGWGIYFSSVSGKANDFTDLTAKVRQCDPAVFDGTCFCSLLSPTYPAPFALDQFCLPVSQRWRALFFSARNSIPKLNKVALV